MLAIGEIVVYVAAFVFFIAGCLSSNIGWIFDGAVLFGLMVVSQKMDFAIRRSSEQMIRLLRETNQKKEE